MKVTSFQKTKLLISSILIFLFIITSVLPVSASNTLQEKQTKKETTTDKQSSSSKKESNVKSSEKEKLVCIVTGEDADPNLKMEYKGKTYYFCCKKCVKKFKDNPEKYIKPSS